MHKKIINNENENNINDINQKEKNNNDIKEEKEKMKSFNQPIKRFNYMDMFHRKNYDFFEKSQNIPNINKYLKNEL